MQEAISINFDRPLPIFPLPGAVLLPHGLLPLHIFEPRYLQMTQEALDSHGLIVMGQFEGAVNQKQYLHGKPTLREHACIGYCRQYRPLNDGRYLLLLCGLCRVRIVREVDHEPYRLVMLEATEVGDGGSIDDGEDLPGVRERIRTALADPALRKLESVRELQDVIKKTIPATAMVDIVISMLCDEPEDRYAMLVEADPQKRADWLLAKLESLRGSHPADGE